MDEETRAIRTDITQTRAELGDAVEELSQRVTPRRQAQRIVTERRRAVRERIGSVSQDIGPMADRARAAIVAQPQAAAALGALALLLLRQRSRRR